MLEAVKISRQFLRSQKGTNVFNAVNETELKLEPGRITVLSGHSGSGKTTLLNMMSGLLEPTSGKVLLNGTDIYRLSDAELSKLRNKSFGIIPQGQTAIQSMTVMENVMLPYTLYADEDKDGSKLAALTERAAELLGETGIAELAEAMPSELSGGELRRMAIARALLLDPEVIFADEPTGDLDDENTQIVLGLLKKAATDGKAVFLVTHDRDAIPCGDVVLTMKSGSIAIA